MEYQNITKLLGSIPDKVPNVIFKKCIEVHDNLVMQIIDINQINK